MYATCLFCNTSLGANESIEHFPVGRRLAYDGTTGRLWVVCRHCERWNLSPLETRWEAIDDAERAFRGTKLRVSTDNIGMAQLKDGTELVRIGQPPEVEFAAWRYGNQFGNRRRNYLLYTSIPAAGILVAQLTGQLGGIAMDRLIATGAGLALSLTGSGIGIALGVQQRIQQYRRKVPAAVVRNGTDKLLHISKVNAQQLEIAPGPHGGDWQLHLQHGNVVEARGIRRWAGGPVKQTMLLTPEVLRGRDAVRALSTILPLLNESGGNQRTVADAVSMVQSCSGAESLLRTASATGKGQYFARRKVLMVHLPTTMRLALEMLLHGDDERRAMSGELRELEQRWREADTIAKIADEMFMTDRVDEHMRALREQRPNDD